MFDNMFQKLQEMQGKVAETKARLDTVKVTEDFQGIRMVMNGNRKLEELIIPEDLAKDPEALEEVLLVALNRIIDKAEQVHQAEMAGAAKGMLPNLPGFGS